jgi:hypothetical protein
MMNKAYLRAARVAAGQVIAQHFLAEFPQHDYVKKRTLRGLRRKKFQTCSTCLAKNGRYRMARRFGETPKNFRVSLEEKIIEKLISFPVGGGPDIAAAKTMAELCVHNWIAFEFEDVTYRRRIRSLWSQDQVKNCFENLCFENKL